MPAPSAHQDELTGQGVPFDIGDLWPDAWYLRGGYPVTAREPSVSDAAFDTLAQVGAWKLDLHDVAAEGTVSINGNTYDRVMGHRDSSATAWPGQYMYNRMGELTDLIGDYQG